MGQRLFTTDNGDLGLMDVRHIKLDVVPEPGVDPEAAPSPGG
jgi:hypothetical protein